MFAAIVAGFVALLVVAAILVAVYAVLRSRKTAERQRRRRCPLHPVGGREQLASRFPPRAGRRRRPRRTPAQPVANPGDNLKSRVHRHGRCCRPDLWHACHEAVQHAGAFRRLLCKRSPRTTSTPRCTRPRRADYILRCRRQRPSVKNRTSLYGACRARRR